MDGSQTQLRTDFYACLTALFELTDAVLCPDGPVRTLVGLSLPPEHRRGHGASYDALNKGWIEVERLRGVLTGLPLPRSSTPCGPADDVAGVTAAQVRDVMQSLIAARQWMIGDP